MSQVKNWCFTINNPVADVAFDETCMQYLHYQKEKGENGTEHFQGFVIFLNKKTLGGVKKFIGNEAHLEKMKGTAKQNVEYCSKVLTRIDGPFIFGKLTSEGSRTDLLGVMELIQNNDLSYLDNPTYVRNMSNLDKYAQTKQVKRNF